MVSALDIWNELDNCLLDIQESSFINYFEMKLKRITVQRVFINYMISTRTRMSLKHILAVNQMKMETIETASCIYTKSFLHERTSLILKPDHSLSVKEGSGSVRLFYILML